MNKESIHKNGKRLFNFTDNNIKKILSKEGYTLRKPVGGFWIPLNICKDDTVVGVYKTDVVKALLSVNGYAVK